ncbi:MAG: hypothetical protein LC539_14085 [Candidatus Thiodiazotropha sp.]|nr:hypothetical protein [Candidatus Thiodiazotropha sp.]
MTRLNRVPRHWHHYRLFTGNAGAFEWGRVGNTFRVPQGIDQVGIACFGRGGRCNIPQSPHGKALGGGGGGAFAYGVLAVYPGTLLTHFGVLDSYTYFHNFLMAGAGEESVEHLGGRGGIATALDSQGLLQDIRLENGGNGGNGQINNIINHYSHGGGGASGSFYGRGGDGGQGYTISQAEAWRWPLGCFFGHGGGGGWGGQGGSSLVGIDAPVPGQPFFGSQSGGGGGGLQDGGGVMIPQGLTDVSAYQSATVPGGGGGAWGPGEDGSGPVVNQRYRPGRGGPGLSHAADGIDDPDDGGRFVMRQSDVKDTGMPDCSTIAIYNGMNGDGHTPVNPFLAMATRDLDGSGGSGAQYFHAGHGGPGGGGGGAGFIDVKVGPAEDDFAGLGNAGHGGFGGGGGGGVGQFVPKKSKPADNRVPFAIAGQGGFGGGGGGGGVFSLDEDGAKHIIEGAGQGGPAGGAGGGPGSDGGGVGCIIIYW